MLVEKLRMGSGHVATRMMRSVTYKVRRRSASASRLRPSRQTAILRIAAQQDVGDRAPLQSRGRVYWGIPKGPPRSSRRGRKLRRP